MFSDFTGKQTFVRALGADQGEISEFAETSEMFPDDLSAISEEELVEQPVEDNACEGIRCIKLYKPCPEGYIDADPCCPNTGKCVLDPDYVIPNVGLVEMQPIGIAAPALPIGQTPSTEFDIPVPMEIPRMEIPFRSSTPLPFERTTSTTEPLTAETSTTETPTTETPATEAPKTNGLAAVAIGLIALELLAT
jgi:hypothetical protein